MKIEFITRDECPLCDEAREMLQGLRRRFALEIEEIDVDGDEELLARYGSMVPVARTTTGRVIAEGRWSKLRLMGALTRYRFRGD